MKQSRICKAVSKPSVDERSAHDIELIRYFGSDRQAFDQDRLEIFAQLSMVVRECVSDDTILSAGEMLNLFCKVSTWTREDLLLVCDLQVHFLIDIFSIRQTVSRCWMEK
jgi:hypothetical protein